jgi:hypothetical protein
LPAYKCFRQRSADEAELITGILCRDFVCSLNSTPAPVHMIGNHLQTGLLLKLPQSMTAQKQQNMVS